MNLRPSSDTGSYLLSDLPSHSSHPGFPAADVDVGAYLTVDETRTDRILRRYHAYFIALFTTARRYLETIDREITSSQTIAQKFRVLMTADIRAPG